MGKLLLIFCLYACVSNADYNDKAREGMPTPSEQLAQQAEEADLAELKREDDAGLLTPYVVPCDTDIDCEAKNPQLVDAE